jgi:hypothetical protein
MEEAGIEVVRFDDATLEKFATYTRQKVWPQIASELDEATMQRLNQAVGL